MIRHNVALLARLLDNDLAAHAQVSLSTRRLAQLAAAIEHSASRQGVQPREDFRSGLRAQLVEVGLAQSPAPPPLLARLRMSVEERTAAWAYSTRMATATSIAALALSGGGVATAAEASLPGDPFYSVKLAFADARLLFVRDAVARGTHLLTEAGERLDEAEIVAEAGNMSGAAQALRAGDGAARRGAGELLQAHQNGSTEALEVLSAFTAQQRPRVTGLRGLLDGEAAKAARDLLVTLERVSERVAALGGGCGYCGRTQPWDEMILVPRAPLDLTDIPPADQPFDVCPCVADPEPSQAAPPPKRQMDGPATPPATAGPPKNPPTRPTQPTPPQEPMDPKPGILPDLPPPLDDALDPVEKVIEDLLEQVPPPPSAEPPTAEPPTTVAPPKLASEAPTAPPSSDTPQPPQSLPEPSPPAADLLP